MLTLRVLDLNNNLIASDGCTALASALSSGALPALDMLRLLGNPASAHRGAGCRGVGDGSAWPRVVLCGGAYRVFVSWRV